MRVDRRDANDARIGGRVEWRCSRPIIADCGDDEVAACDHLAYELPEDDIVWANQTDVDDWHLRGAHPTQRFGDRIDRASRRQTAIHIGSVQSCPGCRAVKRWLITHQQGGDSCPMGAREQPSVTAPDHERVMLKGWMRALY